MMPMSMPFVVRSSLVHGRGAFATRDIVAGTRLAEYTGERISPEESARRSDAELAVGGRPISYRFRIDAVWDLDGAVGGNDTRFINHGCEPNCRAVTESGRILISASRAIREGDELLLDYNMASGGPVPEDLRQLFSCLCGAPTCRGSMLRVVDEGERARAEAR